MILSTDFLLSLIIVALILGTSAELVDMQESRLSEEFREGHVNQKAAAAADILVNTPGDPPSWEKIPVSACKSPGLAVPGERGTISYEKFRKLQSRPELLGRAFQGMRVQLVLRPINSSIRPLVAGENISGDEISVMRIPVNCNFLSGHVIKLQKAVCPCGHPENWTCMNFRFNSSLDYYLISDSPEGSWMLDTGNSHIDEVDLIYGSVKLNLTGEGVAWLHVHGGGWVSVVALPRGSRDYLMSPDYFRVQPCVLEVITAPF
ncbi:MULTISPECIES: hypothetical protein [Methanothermobacter]|jgi:hypothetical protein|uniref:hypothetical protein n=1 Tax=Methanothermobacter TaxID=145260 RepID=UPI0002CD0469|nr:MULTISPECIES: hypothetical protein [unclassified Methanothermobacter]BAM70521.1 conserved hypothetical protein [Methanothermobacter sp. CaT2]BAZ99402.1 hypothetical protein tca_01353 [Methanothermobacter sp. EMTCatA1]